MLIVFAIFMGILFVLISLSLVWIIIGLIATILIRLPYVNTPRGYCEKFLDKVDFLCLTVYDLGCGDAHFLKRCVQKGAKKCVGYELSPMAYLTASIKTLMKPIKIRFGDFFKADISEADVVYIYLVKTVLAKLSPKLKSEAKAGCIIITVGSSLSDWTPEKIISLNGDYSAYVYKK